MATPVKKKCLYLFRQLTDNKILFIYFWKRVKVKIILIMEICVRGWHAREYCLMNVYKLHLNALVRIFQDVCVTKKKKLIHIVCSVSLLVTFLRVKWGKSLNSVCCCFGRMCNSFVGCVQPVCGCGLILRVTNI